MTHAPGPHAVLTVLSILIPAAVLTSAPRSADITIVDTGQTPFLLGSTKEFSGITYAGGERYYAVSDKEQAVYPLTIAIDARTGQIRSATVDVAVRLTDDTGTPLDGPDLEGIAFDPASHDVYVSDESTTGDPRRSIREHRLSDGRQVGAIDLAGAHLLSPNMRDNLGLESLSLAGQTLWTSNEEALVSDGDTSTTAHGSIVRLSRFDAGTLAGQFAYVTEPTGGRLRLGDDNLSGVSDVLALPDGTLLVLERATSRSGVRGGTDGFVSRIYRVDVSGATDIRALAGLRALMPGRDYTPAAKFLLWHRTFPLLAGVDNFEGLTLGPALANGHRSLLLVADNGGLPSALLALEVSVPQPDARAASRHAAP